MGLAMVAWLTEGKGKHVPHPKRFIAEQAQIAKRGKTVQNVAAGAGLPWSSAQARLAMRQSMPDFLGACRQADGTSQCVWPSGRRRRMPARALQNKVFQPQTKNFVALRSGHP